MGKSLPLLVPLVLLFCRFNLCRSLELLSHVRWQAPEPNQQGSAGLVTAALRTGPSQNVDTFRTQGASWCEHRSDFGIESRELPRHQACRRPGGRELHTGGRRQPSRDAMGFFLKLRDSGFALRGGSEMDIAEDDDESEPVQTQQRVRRGKNRARKIATVDESDGEEENEEDYNEEEGRKPSRRARQTLQGRGRKKKAEVDANKMEEPPARERLARRGRRGRNSAAEVEEDSDEERESSAELRPRRRGRPSAAGRGERKKSVREEESEEEEEEDEEAIEAAMKEFAQQRDTIRRSHQDVEGSPRAAKYLDPSFQRPRPGTQEFQELFEYSQQLKMNNSVWEEVFDEGPDPFFDWPETHEGEMPPEDGFERFEGDDGEVYIADSRGLDHVNDYGFDADGNFYPFKDLGDERFNELLDKHLEEDQRICEEQDREDDEEVMRTGTIKRLQFRELLDEDGHLLPQCLEPNSTFLQENDLVDPDWVLPGPSRIRWRGPDIDAAEVGGGVKEWAMACNDEVVIKGNETTMLRHTGVGCVIELFHKSDGWFAFRAAPEEQTYHLFEDGQMGRVMDLLAEDLVDFLETDADDIFEYKMKTTHWFSGNWRGMLVGPRVVVWNVKSPEMEIHLTDDGFIFIGDAGRAFQVKANAMHPDRYSMYFTNTWAAFDMIRDHYNHTRPCIWERVPTEDLFGYDVFIKVLRHESAPDPRLRYLTEEEWQVKKELVRKGKMETSYDRDELVRNMWDDRARALRLRNDSTEAFVPSSSHMKDLTPGFNHKNNITGTAGRGFYDANGVWRDDWAFTEIPRYRQKLSAHWQPHTNNELEEERHFERLAELKRLKEIYSVLKKASCPPDKWTWQYRLNYSNFDMQGIPTHHLDGEPLSPAERHELEEDYRMQEKAHAGYQKEIEEHPDLLIRLSQQVDYLQMRVTFYDPYQMTVDNETQDYRALWSDVRPEDLFHREKHDYPEPSSSDDFKWNPRWG